MSDATKSIKDCKNDLEKQIKTFQESEGKSDESFLSIGTTLVQIKELSGLNKSEFSELKKETAGKLSKTENGNRRNIDKVVKVVSTKHLNEYKGNLPKSWTKLYLLATLKEEQFNTLVSEGFVTEDVIRKDLIEKVKSIKGIKSKANNTVTIMLSDDAVPTEQNIKDLSELLLENGWKIKIPINKPKKSDSEKQNKDAVPTPNE
jgi:hypothetical protein